MSTRCARAAAALLATASMAAHAEPAVELTARESVTHIHHFGGFAIVGSEGDDGSLTPVTDLSPATLDLANTHQHSGSYLYWEVAYTQTWSLAQTFTVDPAAHAISASGSTRLDNDGTVWGLNCSPCRPTMQIDSLNTQVLEFSLTEATAYSFHSLTTGGQYVDLLQWVPAASGWGTVWYGALVNENRTWDSSGTLQAGLYRLRNDPYGQRQSGQGALDSGWSYTMTLPGAVLTPVPEPRTAWMLAAGLLLLGVRRLRP